MTVTQDSSRSSCGAATPVLRGPARQAAARVVLPVRRLLFHMRLVRGDEGVAFVPFYLDWVGDPGYAFRTRGWRNWQTR